MRCPSGGKRNRAMPLSKNITAIATPVSTLDADIAGSHRRYRRAAAYRGAGAEKDGEPALDAEDLAERRAYRERRGNRNQRHPQRGEADLQQPRRSASRSRAKSRKAAKSFFEAAEVSFCAGLPTVSAIARPSANPTAGFGVITESAAAAANQKYLFPAVHSRKVPFVSIALFPQGFSYYAGL